MTGLEQGYREQGCAGCGDPATTAGMAWVVNERGCWCWACEAMAFAWPEGKALRASKPVTSAAQAADHGRAVVNGSCAVSAAPVPGLPCVAACRSTRPGAELLLAALPQAGQPRARCCVSLAAAVGVAWLLGSVMALVLLLILLSRKR